MNTGLIVFLCGLFLLHLPARMALALEAGLPQATPIIISQTRSNTRVQTSHNDTSGSLEEMREWLDQRNMNRKQQGTDSTEFNTTIKNTAAHKSREARKQIRLADKIDKIKGGEEDAPATNLVVDELKALRGADGRIRHRLVIHEDGPDQLQIDSGSGYSSPDVRKQDSAKLGRLTSRGKQAWLAGSYLRAPASYYVLKPKGWNHPKFITDR